MTKKIMFRSLMQAFGTAVGTFLGLRLAVELRFGNPKIALAGLLVRLV